MSMSLPVSGLYQERNQGPKVEGDRSSLVPVVVAPMYVHYTTNYYRQRTRNGQRESWFAGFAGELLSRNNLHVIRCV